MNTRLERARTLLAGAMGLASGQIPDRATVRDLEGWDSLGHLRIVAAIEAETGTTLTAEQILGLASLPDIAALLKKTGSE
jgi:acyl carrier protein